MEATEAEEASPYVSEVETRPLSELLKEQRFPPTPQSPLLALSADAAVAAVGPQDDRGLQAVRRGEDGAQVNIVQVVKTAVKPILVDCTFASVHVGLFGALSLCCSA